MSGPCAPRSKSTLAIALSEGVENQDEIPPVSATRAPATRVSATGRGAVAEQIIAIALDHGVKVRRDDDLAEILSVLDVDSPIPLGALSTVAGILTYVYRAKATPEKATLEKSTPEKATLEAVR